MSHRSSRKLTVTVEVALTIGLVGLLTFAPACSFIEGLIGGGGGDGDGAVVQGDGAVANPDGGVAANIPQPPPVVPQGVPDAAAIAAAMKNMPDGGLPPGYDPSKLPPGFDPSQIPDGGLPPGFDPSKLPPGFDPSKLPPGFDPSKLPPGFDPSKLPPGVDPADLAGGNVPVGDGGAAAEGDGGGAAPPPMALPPGMGLPPDAMAQLQKAANARQKIEGQIRRLDYMIDRNLTKNPADVIKLNRLVRARREIDARLEQTRKQHNIPPEMFRQLLKQAEQ